MTVQMICALAALIVMVLLIMTDALPFGAPPILASLLLVVSCAVFGADWEVQWDVAYAFAGFTSGTVWLVAFFVAVMAALQKTKLSDKIRAALFSLVEKGGYKSYVLLIVVLMLAASILGGQTGTYVMALTIVSNVPYNKELPPSKLVMPLGMASVHPLIPLNVATYYAVAVSLLESVASSMGISMINWMILNFVGSMAFLAWALVGYRLLPNHDINRDGASGLVSASSGEKELLSPGKERFTIVITVIAILGMIFMSNLGVLAYALPGLCAFALLFAGVIDFKEMRESLFSPIILMMAGVIPVANALSDSGLAAFVGEAIAGALGTSVPGVVVVFIFALLTTVTASFTGSNMGSIFIYAPFAVATCMALGLDPAAAAAAVTMGGCSAFLMPIDGLPALIFGIGNYSLKEFWSFMVPMVIIRLVALTAACVILFPL